LGEEFIAERGLRGRRREGEGEGGGWVDEEGAKSRGSLIVEGEVVVVFVVCSTSPYERGRRVDGEEEVVVVVVVLKGLPV